MVQFYKIFFAFASILICSLSAQSQLIITGTVYDSTRTIPVKGVIIKSSSGNFFTTDSTGRYTIVTTERDSLVFIYQNKPTLKFAVQQMKNTGNFDIALHIRITDKYKMLKEVKVFGKNYREDSIANREAYAKIFNYEKPGIKISSDPYSGAMGMDLDEFINMFRFRRNRQLRKMQERLQEQEKESYIKYRFNKTIVRRITQLQDSALDIFMEKYKPGYEFALTSSLPDFYQYILNASYEFNQKMEEDKFINNRFNKVTVKLITELSDATLDDFMKKYRPSYAFTYHSNISDFYQYIVSAAEQYKKQLHPKVNSTDSLLKH